MSTHKFEQGRVYYSPFTGRVLVCDGEFIDQENGKLMLGFTFIQLGEKDTTRDKQLLGQQIMWEIESPPSHFLSL